MPSAPAGYSGTPLVQKLGVRPGARVVLLGAPPDFARTLGALPDGASLATRGAGEVVVAFARDLIGLDRRLPAARRALKEGGRLWLAWPKKASGVETNLAEGLVRDAGLAAGLVDYKVCAIDATWSGLCFAVRR